MLKEEADPEDESTENRENTLTDCSFEQRMICQTDALRIFRNQFKDAKEYLFWIGRYILRLKYKDMEEIFRLDSSNICRISKKADMRIRK